MVPWSLARGPLLVVLYKGSPSAQTCCPVDPVASQTSIQDLLLRFLLSKCSCKEVSCGTSAGAKLLSPPMH
eukprot:5096953-Karenia_brevis.AAC.1